jgi:DNA-binding MarR family transcriptional regulator
MAAIRPDDTETSRRQVSLGRLLRTAHASHNMTLRDRLEKYGITFSQFQHLYNLWREDGINQTELSGRIGIMTASSTAVLNSLEKMGLIRRVRNGDDRRNVQVFLTAASETLKAPLERHALEINEQATRGMTSAEVKTLYGLLARVIANFNTPE